MRVNEFKMNNKAFEILEILNKHGSAYLVGGCVRDIFLGIVPHDFDIVSNVSMDKIEELFSTHSIGKNKDFGILVVNYKGESFEISQCRVDGAYKNHRHPSEISIVDDVKLDVFRRDFSCNGLLMNSEETIIDYVGGLEDIKNKILRTIGNPYERFEEDALRLLRAIRFSNRFDFTIEENTYKALCENASKIQFIAKERIHQELIKMCSMGGKKFAKCIENMSECGLLKYIYPEVENLKNFPHSKIHHPESTDVFGHVIEALKCCESNKSEVLLSILFHDLGKQLTYVYNEEKQKHSYHGHDEKGIELIDQISKRFNWSNDLKQIVCYCCLNHMKFHTLYKMKKSKIIKLLFSEFFNYLYEVAKCDTFCRGYNLAIEEWTKNENKLNELKKEGITFEYFQELRKVINGEFIMKHRNIKTGKEVGYFLQKLLDFIIDHKLDFKNEKEIIKYLKGFMYNE